MLRCFIVDDTPSSVRLLNKYVLETEGLESVGHTDSGLDALKILQSKDSGVDIVFLDIDIWDISGLEILEKIAGSYIVILVSGHHTYAQEAFVKGAAGYLYKPLEYDRFYAAIQKVRNSIQPKKKVATPSYIYVPGDGRQVRIRIRTNQILYVQSSKNFSTLFMDDKTNIFCSLSLKQLEAMLYGPNFIRVNRSVIINAEKIVKYDAHDVHLEGGKEIGFGEQYRNHFINALGANGFGF